MVNFFFLFFILVGKGFVEFNIVCLVKYPDQQHPKNVLNISPQSLIDNYSLLPLVPMVNMYTLSESHRL